MIKKLLALALGVGIAAPASAAIFNFSYAGSSATFGSVAASGTLTTSDTATIVDGRRAFAITGISGVRNGVAITGLVPAGSDFGGAMNDNLLLADEPHLLFGGIGFTVAGSTNRFNAYFNSEIYIEFVGNADGDYVQNIDGLTFTVAPPAVPEPASWAMMIGGFGLVGGAMRRRRVGVRFA